MKKIIIITLMFIFIALSSSLALAYEHSRRINYISFPEINFNKQNIISSLFNQYSNNKLSANDLVIKAAKIINSKDENKNIDLSSSTIENIIVHFVAFTYANYNCLSENAIEEFRKTPYCFDKYINKKFTSDEINILHSHGKKYLSGNGNNYYNLIDSFQKLAETNCISYSEAALFMLLIGYIDYGFELNYNINVKEFRCPPHYILDWISTNYSRLTDKKIIPLLQLLDNLNFMIKLKSLKKNRKSKLFDQANYFFHVSSLENYPDNEKYVKKVFDSFVLAKQKYEKHLEIIGFLKPLSWYKAKEAHIVILTEELKDDKSLAITSLETLLMKLE